jgi:hypothetical protein
VFVSSNTGISKQMVNDFSKNGHFRISGSAIAAGIRVHNIAFRTWGRERTKKKCFWGKNCAGTKKRCFWETNLEIFFENFRKKLWRFFKFVFDIRTRHANLHMYPNFQVSRCRDGGDMICSQMREAESHNKTRGTLLWPHKGF